MRRGHTLVEALVAMLLLALVGAIALPTAARLVRAQATLHAATTRLATVHDAALLLARHLDGLPADSGRLRVARDTVLDALAPLGLALSCRVAGDTVWLAAGDSLSPWAPQLRREPVAGDEVHLPRADGATDRRVIRAVLAGGRCDDARWGSMAAWRLVRDATPGHEAGAVLRLLARERWTLQRSGDGSWSLALATWDAPRDAFVTAQPVAGPLASPASVDGPGFEVQPLDAVGASSAGALARTRQLLIHLRARPDHAGHAVRDSILIDVAPT